LNITAERIPESQVLLTIEVDPERVEKSMERAYRKVVPRVRVPGFRPGKAPRSVLERHVGRESLLHEALDLLVPEIVEEAIKEQDLQIVDRPDLEIASLNPVVIKATVPVRPTIDLGDYRELRLEPETVETDETEADRSIDSLRRRYATIEPVERPVQEGDRVRVNLSGEVEGKRAQNFEDAEIAVRAEALATIPGVFEKIQGMSKGETVTFEAELPEDYGRSDLAGKTITYTLEVLDVKEEVLPELDDDFAAQVGEGFASMQALRERLETDIRTRNEEEAKRKLQDQALDALVNNATMEFPPQLVEREVEHMLRDLTRQGQQGGDPRAMDRFLQAVGRSEGALREQFRPSAIDRVKRSLALSTLAESEGIEITPAEIEAELDTMSGQSEQAAQIRAIFDTPSGREMIERQLHSRRTLERLTQIVTGQAPEPPVQTETEASAAPEETSAAPAASEDQQEDTATE
jgi:trigger factor